MPLKLQRKRLKTGMSSSGMVRIKLSATYAKSMVSSLI